VVLAIEALDGKGFGGLAAAAVDEGEVTLVLLIDEVGGWVLFEEEGGG